MQFWFVPTWCGDFRLEASGRGGRGSLLSVEDPTEKDRLLLVPFLAAAKERGWIKRMPTIKLIGKTLVRLPVPVTEAGPVLVGNVHQGEAVWTALRYASGQVTVEDGTGRRHLYGADGKLVETSQLPAPAKGAVEKVLDAAKGAMGSVVEAVGGAVEAAREAVSAAVTPEPEPVPVPVVAAATVREPKRGCPAPTAAARRASEVLRTFSTASQWASWQRTGSMLVVGSSSGQSYRLFHRDEAARRRMAHCLVDVRTGVDVCAWDDRVPPEEEALSLKLAVEHRERWLLSPHGNTRELVRELR